MYKKFFITLLIPAISLIPSLYASSLTGTANDSIPPHRPSQKNLRADVEFLAGDVTQGRGRGQKGHTETAFCLALLFRYNGLIPFGDSFVTGREGVDGKDGIHNVAGMVDGGKGFADNYIIIGANYDGMGKIDDKFYPGADANASGLAALIEIARAFKLQKIKGRVYDGNVIFVAFDGYTDGRCGAAAFWEMLSKGKLTDPSTGRLIKPSDITAMIDMDQIGAVHAPCQKGLRNYLIAIGEDSLPSRYEGLLNECNLYCNSQLNIYRSYYGSEKFTKTFYRLGDRRFFIDNRIPTVYFTSGITQYNNTVNDRPESLDYDIFARRVALIFRFIERLL